MFKRVVCSILIATTILFNLPPFERNSYAEENIPPESSVEISSQDETSAASETVNAPETVVKNSEPKSNSNKESEAKIDSDSKAGQLAVETPFYSYQSVMGNFGAQFQVDPFSGAAVASVGISIPPGRRGIQPNLSLIYSSQNGNGICGIGWMLDLGSIVRSTKNGPPKYDSTDNFVLSNSGTAKELVAIGGNEYRAKSEEDFKRFKFENNFWVITDKSGTKYYFGQDASSQIVDAGKIFKWCLNRVEDVMGNYLTIQYEKNQNQLYLFQIDYNEQKFKIKFEYESRMDSQSAYITTYNVTTSRRLKTVKVFGENEELIRRYEIAYKSSSSLSQSLIESITQYAPSGESLPATTFNYQQQSGSVWAETSMGWFNSSESFEAFSYLTDFNRDGITDAILVNGHQAYRGTPECNWQPYSFRSEWTTDTFGNATGWTNGHGDCGFRLADINADGWVDVTYHTHTDDGVAPAYVYLSNQQNGWSGGPDYSIPCNPYFIYAHTQTQWEYHDFMGLMLVDINVDGRVDLIQKAGSWNEVLLNMPTGWMNDSRWLISDGNINDGSSAFGDLNGDGLVDYLILTSSESRAYLNTGNGWVRDSTYDAVGKGDFTNNSTELIDVNNDGRADLVVAKSDRHNVYLNSFDSANRWQEDSNYQLPSAVRFDNFGSRAADINADGWIDLMVNESPSNRHYYQHSGSNINLLSSINSGTGAITSIQYTPSTHFDNTGEDEKADLGFPIQLVTSVTSTDNIRNQSYTTTYNYQNGLFSYSEREFRGFGKVTTIDSEGTTSEIYSWQDDVLKGKPKRKVVKNSSGQLIQDEVYTWATQDLGNGTIFPYQCQVDTYVHPSMETKSNPSKEIKHTKAVQEYAFSDTVYGKIISSTTKYTYSNGGAKDEEYDLKEVSEFISRADADHWLIDLPVHSWVEGGDGLQYRQAWNYYDENHSQNPEAITKGLLTKQTGWSGSGKDDKRKNATSDDPYVLMTYDAYGNMRTKSSPRDEAWLSTVVYDEDYHQYPVTHINSLNQSVNTIYDARFGVSTQTTDPNNVTTRNILDEFGRTIEVIGPYDSENYPGVIYEYNLNSSPLCVIKKERFKNLDDIIPDEPFDSNYMVTYAFLDGLGRVIEIKTIAEDPSFQILSGYNEYDSRGQVIKQFYPWLVSNTGSSFTSIDTSGVPYAKSEYDAIGRTVKTYSPKSAGLWSESVIAYDGWDIATVDANHHQSITRKDAFGRLIRIEEFEGTFETPDFSVAPYAVTQYFYNPIGELTQVVDAAGNTTTITYDTLGRKLSMDDPDMGHYVYTYDNAGNLETQTDNQNQTIEFTYDQINRLTSKGLVGQNGVLTNSVNYQYDNYKKGGLKANSTGRLVEVNDNSGSTRFYYDQLGREIQSEKTIDGRIFSVERIYDALGRIISIRYPDNETVQYAYNLQGQIESIYAASNNFVVDADYDEYGQITGIQYGNGVVTNYTYDLFTRRLARILACSNSEIIQDLSYNFDDNGNILDIIDAIGPNTQHFAYDALDRLIFAQGALYSPINYEYNAIGNLLRKGDYYYTYGENGTGPHAATTVTNGLETRNYFYDNNGNMAGRPGNIFYYDSENRLIQMTDELGKFNVANFNYDGDGGRIKKCAYSQFGELDKTTYYVGSLFELDKRKITVDTIRKHIFMGSSRLATLESQGGAAQVYFYHADQLDSTNKITTSDGSIVQEIYYTPFGETADETINRYFTADFKFTGKELDEETGLYYYGARYYDPFLGRFITPDSIVQAASDPQSLNRYSYCRNNPLKYTDPTGHKWSWKKFWHAFVGIFIGAITVWVVGPLGFNLVGTTMAGVIGGATGGALTGGLDGGGMSALIGAGIGGVTGGVSGWAVGGEHYGVLAGMSVAGVGAAGATDNWDSFVGGLTGGIAGGLAGNGITSAYKEQFANYRAGYGFRSNETFVKEADGNPSAALTVEKSKAASGDPIIDDPNVRAEMDKALEASLDGQKKVREQGGWLLRDPRDTIEVQPWPQGKSDSIRIPSTRPDNAIASFHTHPYASNETFIHGPSSGIPGDYYQYNTNTSLYGLKHYVIDRVGIMSVTSHSADGTGTYQDTVRW